MAVFMLDCDSVTSTGSSINSLSSQVTAIADSVNGYDTSNEDGFDFASAKSAIASNIEACATKVTNSAALVEAVVTSHTQLQSSLTGTGDNGKQDGGDNNNGGTDTGGGTYTGGGSYSGGGGGSYIAPVMPTTAPEDEDKPTDVTDKVKEVDTTTVDLENMTEEEKNLILQNMEYDSLGYAKIDNRYVISCDKSFAEVGDVITITRADGTHVDCVVGSVSDTKGKDNLSFITNDKWDKDCRDNIVIDMKDKNVKIEKENIKLKVINQSTESNATTPETSSPTTGVPSSAPETTTPATGAENVTNEGAEG